MYGAEAEGILAKLDKRMPEIAASLRRLRDKIATKDPDQWRRESDAADQRERDRKHREWCLESGIPARIVDMVCANSLRDNQATRELAKALKRPLPHGARSRIVLLGGGIGTGKTVAAGWRLAETGYGRFVKATYYAAIDLSNDGQSKRDAIKATRFLVVDDLGQEPPQLGWRMADLLDTRYDGSGTTIITSNLSDDEIGKRYGAQLIERINERGGYVACAEKVRPG